MSSGRCGCARARGRRRSWRKTEARRRTDSQSETAPEKWRPLPMGGCEASLAMHLPASSAMPLQYFSRAIQRRGQHRALLAGALQIMLVEGFVHAGNHDRGIPCVLAGRVDGVMKPGAIGQSLGDQESALGLPQPLIQPGRVVAGIFLLSPHLRPRLFELMGGAGGFPEAGRLAAEYGLGPAPGG